MLLTTSGTILKLSIIYDIYDLAYFISIFPHWVLSIKSIGSGDLLDNLDLFENFQTDINVCFSAILSKSTRYCDWNRLHIEEELMVLVLSSCHIMNCMRIISFEYDRRVPVPLISPYLPRRKPIKNPADVRAETMRAISWLTFAKNNAARRVHLLLLCFIDACF